jgi:hypothetical protein
VTQSRHQGGSRSGDTRRRTAYAQRHDLDTQWTSPSPQLVPAQRLAEQWDTWLDGSLEQAITLQRPLPNELLRIVATGEKSDLARVEE